MILKKQVVVFKYAHFSKGMLHLLVFKAAHPYIYPFISHVIPLAPPSSPYPLLALDCWCMRASWVRYSYSVIWVPVLIGCLKSPPQWTLKPSRLLKRWPDLLWRVALRLRQPPSSATETIPPSGQPLQIWIILVLVCLSPLTINFCSSISFLYDNQCPAYHLYQRKVQEYRAAGSKNSSLPAAGAANLRQPAAPQVHATDNASSSPHSTEADNPPVKRKRKSRWGSEDERVELPIPQAVAPPESNVSDPDAASLTGKLITIS